MKVVDPEPVPGLTYPLARATIDCAMQRARALEAYPVITRPGREIAWGEAHVGARQGLTAAGFDQTPVPVVGSHRGPPGNR